MSHYHHTRTEDEADSTQTPQTPFKEPSEWTPPIRENETLDKYCNIIEIELMKSLKDSPARTTKNLTKNQEQALESLKSNEDMIIKPADKRGAVVIQKKRDYINEINRQLSDRSTYHRKLQGHALEISK